MVNNFLDSIESKDKLQFEQNLYKKELKDNITLLILELLTTINILFPAVLYSSIIGNTVTSLGVLSGCTLLAITTYTITKCYRIKQKIKENNKLLKNLLTDCQNDNNNEVTNIKSYNKQVLKSKTISQQIAELKGTKRYIIESTNKEEEPKVKKYTI